MKSITGQPVKIPMTLPPLIPNPLVSVLMANYNYGKYVAEALGSVVNQTYSKLEIIVCDDGSTDDSCKVIEGYIGKDSRVGLIRKENGRHASAINRAFGWSKGEIICMLDSDDLFEMNKLEKIVEAFKNNGDCGMVIHNMRVVDGNGKIIRSAIYRQTGYIGPEIPTLRMGLPLPQSSGLAFRREVLREILPLPEKDFRTAADWAIGYGAAYLSRTVLVPEFLACYRVHGTNISGTTSTANKLDERMIERNLNGINRVINYVDQFMKERFGICVPQSRVRNVIEHRMILGILKKDRKLTKVARAELRESYRVVRRDYPFYRYLFWNILGILPGEVSRRLLNFTFLVFRFANRYL